MNSSYPFSPTLPQVAGFGEFRAAPLTTSMVIGNLLNWGLLGVLGVQVYTYYLAFPTDKRYLQFMVYFILATQLAQTLLCTRDAFTIFARSFGNIQVLDKIHTLWLSYPIMGGLVALIYQSFSAHRVYKCTGKKISAVVVSLLSITGFGGALTFAIRMKLNGNLSSCVTDIHNFIAYGVWNVASATCDVVITVIMVYNLVRYTEDTEKAMLLINKIIRLTVGTGMATAAAAISSTVIFVGFRHTPVIAAFFLVPGLTIGKLYGITLLTALNARLEVVGGRHNSDSTPNHHNVINIQPDLFFPANGRKAPLRWFGSEKKREEAGRVTGENPIVIETHQYVCSDRPQSNIEMEG